MTVIVNDWRIDSDLAKLLYKWLVARFGSEAIFTKFYRLDAASSIKNVFEYNHYRYELPDNDYHTTTGKKTYKMPNNIRKSTP